MKRSMDSVDARRGQYFIGTLQMNSESARSMGMATNMQRRWSEHHEASLAWQALASDRASRLSTGAKFARQVLQTLALAAGVDLQVQVRRGAEPFAEIVGEARQRAAAAGARPARRSRASSRCPSSR